MATPSWWATGLLFENCNCQLVCPAHFSFKQLCTRERCLGLWAMTFEEGAYGGTSLRGLNAAVLWDSPRHMIAGGWTTALLIDDRADESQREAVENVLSGKAGGPWEVLARFVGTRLEARAVPIHFEEAGRTKRMWVDGLFDTTIEALLGRDKAGDVVLANLFNQIHASTQVLALGKSRCSDRRLPFTTDGTHALYSKFSWRVP
jgi:hypothetical protein